MEASPSRRAIGTRRSMAAFAALAVIVAGCTASGPPPAIPVVAGAVPTIAFESIDGPPPGVFQRLVQNLAAEAEVRQIAVVSRQGAANYRVRGYLATQIVRGRAYVSWVWDVYDDDRLRTLRISGEEPGGRPGTDAWDVADEAMLRKIARASLERISTMLNSPNTAVGGPFEPVPASPAAAAALRR